MKELQEQENDANELKVSAPEADTNSPEKNSIA